MTKEEAQEIVRKEFPSAQAVQAHGRWRIVGDGFLLATGARTETEAWERAAIDLQDEPYVPGQWKESLS